MKDFSVTLMDCPIGSDDKDQAESTFSRALIKQLGSSETVVEAYSEYERVFAKYEELPLPQEASQGERAAIKRWQDAENIAACEALQGFLGDTGGAYFELTI